MSAATDDPTGIPIPVNGTYLADRQVKEWQAEIETLERTLGDPGALKQLQDPSGAAQHLRNMQAAMRAEAPPDTTPEQRDALAKEERELIDEIAPAMLSQEEMRKCPAGAIGAELKFQRAFKKKIIRWKNIRRIRHKGDDDPDVSNLELHRGTTNRLPSGNPLIPGRNHFLSPDTPEYREGYERTFGGPEADPAEVEALKEQIANLTERFKALADAPEAKPAASKPRRSFVPTDAPCGKTFKSPAGAAGHARHCKCKVEEAQGDTT